MKRDLLKVCIFMSLAFLSVEIYAEDGCDAYMEFQSIESEAQVYQDQESQKASVTEFSQKIRMEIEEANALLAEID